MVATLQVHLNGSCSNEITRCKELLAFLKDQVLPKMSKLVSSKRLKKIKGDDKREGGNWFRRMWPSKARKRFVAKVLRQSVIKVVRLVNR